ncbi:hypothetical protein [Amycolatopsis cynarae]
MTNPCEVHGEDTRASCVDHVGRNWTDLRPKSLAELMDSASRG